MKLVGPEKLVFNDQDLYGLDVRQMGRNEQFTELLRRHVKVIQKYQQHRLSSEFDLKHFRRLLKCPLSHKF